MSMLASDITVDLPYSKDACFSAMYISIEKGTDYTVRSSNEEAGFIQASTVGSMTTWGEIISISITQTGTGSSVKISSNSKVPGIFSAKKNSQNLQAMIDRLTSELKDYTPFPSPTTAAPSFPQQNLPIKSRLAALDELHNDGLISDEEFSQKRANILATL